jgi:hypothetical protein
MQWKRNPDTRSAVLGRLQVVGLACTCSESPATSPAQRAVEREGGGEMRWSHRKSSGGYRNAASIFRASNLALHLTRAFGAPGYQRSFHLLLVGV